MPNSVPPFFNGFAFIGSLAIMAQFSFRSKTLRRRVFPVLLFIGGVPTLTALGQIAAIWVGGGTLIPWALIPAAAICNVDPFEMARRNLIPVFVGLIVTTIVAMFQVGGQAVLGRQSLVSTPWLTERLGYDPTWRWYVNPLGINPSCCNL